MVSVTKSMVKKGLALRRHRKLLLAVSFLSVFIPALVLLLAFLGTRTSNVIAAFAFACAAGLVPFLAAEAVMLLPVKFLKLKLETSPTQTLEAACSPETAVARVWRVFSERKIEAKYLKHFTGHEGMVLKAMGAKTSEGGETLLSFQPFFAISIGRNSAEKTVAAMYYEKDSVGLTLAEVIKSKLKMA